MKQRIPYPSALGMPRRYTEWRAGQEEAIRAIDDSEETVTSLRLPPGAGKTGIYMGWAMWRRKRVLVLTANLTLQDQIAKDFEGCGLLDIRGQSNYRCVVTDGKVSEAPCHAGVPCEKKDTTCEYFPLLPKARQARLVSTNYSFFLHNPGVLGSFDLIVMDEFHSALDKLAEFVGVSFSKKECADLFPRHPTSDWHPWSTFQLSISKSQLTTARDKAMREKTPETYADVIKKKRIVERLQTLVDADPSSLIFQHNARSWTWSCVWPGNYRSRLFNYGARFVLTSGTMTPRTMSMMGFGKTEYAWHEFPSTFPRSRRPIYVLPAPAMNHKCVEADYIHWLHKIDRFVGHRVAFKGIIHSGSYKRTEMILSESQHKGLMIGHLNREGLDEALRRFKRAEEGILVSPSITEGVDFPYEMCRFSVIGKIPFPNPYDPVIAARIEQNDTYMLYVAAQIIMQAAMRGMRAEDDWCETAIIDGTWDAWFYSRAQYFFADYFRAAVINVDGIPKLSRIAQKTLDELQTRRDNSHPPRVIHGGIF